MATRFADSEQVQMVGNAVLDAYNSELGQKLADKACDMDYHGLSWTCFLVTRTGESSEIIYYGWEYGMFMTCFFWGEGVGIWWHLHIQGTSVS